MAWFLGMRILHGDAQLEGKKGTRVSTNQISDDLKRPSQIVINSLESGRCHMASKDCVSIVSDKPVPVPMLTYHQSCHLIFPGGPFY